MTLWQRPVDWLKARPFLADAILALVVAALSVPALWGHPTGTDAADYRNPSLVGLALLLLGSVPLAWRRVHPMAVMALVFTGVVAYESFGFPTNNLPVGAFVALYTVAAHCDRKRSTIALAASALGVVIVLATARWKVDVGTVVSNTVTFGAAWLIGENLKTRRAYVASLRDRAEQAEATRIEEARRAVAEERTRIARELHDVVAHSMSVMIVQAGAARRVLLQRPDQATEALLSVETTGREAMTEMRRLLGVLREESDTSAALTPQPSVRNLAALVEPCTEVGLAVSIEIEGEPRDLPAGVDLSAYRIVQEALTNARKHAGPASATVVVRYRDDWIDVEVSDDGRGASSAPDGAHADNGHGLVGMRERVELFGGDLTVGPRPGGGFAVRARLPIEAVAG